MKAEEQHKDVANRHIDNTDEEHLEGYPLYPPDEDIYNRLIEDNEVNLDEISNTKELVSQPGTNKNLKIPEPLSPLDIPGAELDDPEELIGSEDEENNYYSLGGDNHENLEEDNGD
jgi:hypothetical protein